MAQKKQQLIYIGTDDRLLRGIHRAIAIPSNVHYRVIATDEPAEAVVAAQQFPFFIALVDLNSAFDTGVKALELLLEVPLATLRQRIALVYGHPQTADLNTLLRAGATSVVSSIDTHPERLLPFLRR